jgi:APA family basic amino acid/polyamine antiporter
VRASRERESTELVRGLGGWDATLLVIGSVLGGGIFITTGDMARALPHEGMILLVWVIGGALTLAGALTYAELGVMFPRAGGIYHYLKEAYGPLPGFLYGWACFVVVFSGGIAGIAVGAAEYLGTFVPFSTTANALASISLGGTTWTLSGAQAVAAAVILALTLVNWLGLREGALLQGALTLLKIGAVVVFVAAAFAVPARSAVALAAPLPAGGLLTAFGVAMVAALWSYDGWYGVTMSAGEMRDPARHLPIGLIAGTAACIAMYALLNLVYFRALPLAEVAGSARVGEAAATALFGAGGGRLLAAAVLVSGLGCLASTILYASRLYMPMAEDGVFFRGLAAVGPRFRTPGRSLWAQGVWSALLALSGTYDQLYTYAIFVGVLFHAATGAAVFVLRRQRPDAPRPYRVPGYPVVPALFILASLALVANTLAERPMESLLGLGLLALGLPAYAYWRRAAVRVKGAGPGVGIIGTGE